MLSVASCSSTHVKTTNKVIPCLSTDLMIINESAFNLLDEQALDNFWLINTAYVTYCGN